MTHLKKASYTIQERDGSGPLLTVDRCWVNLATKRGYCDCQGKMPLVNLGLSLNPVEDPYSFFTLDDGTIIED